MFLREVGMMLAMISWQEFILTRRFLMKRLVELLIPIVLFVAGFALYAFTVATV